MEMNFAVLFTGIGNAGFKGSSLGSSGNFDGGCYGFGKGSPYYRGPPEPEVRITKMELPDAPRYIPIYQQPPVIQNQGEIETYRLELEQEETSLRMRYEHSFSGLGIEVKDSFSWEYSKKTSLLGIARDRKH